MPRVGVPWVLVVDDHRTFTDLLGRAIDAEDDLNFVGAAHTVEEAVARARALPRRWSWTCRSARATASGHRHTAPMVPGLRVVVLTAYATQSLLQRAVDVGAWALLPKDGSLEDLLDALRARDDGFHVHPALLRRLLDCRRGPFTRPRPLTARESEVLHLLAEGPDPAAIARRLGISRHTSRDYVATLLTKLGAHSQLEAVAIATRRGLLHGRS